MPIVVVFSIFIDHNDIAWIIQYELPGPNRPVQLTRFILHKYWICCINSDQLVLFWFLHKACHHSPSLCTFFLYRRGFSALLNILFDYIIMHPGSVQSVALVHRWEEQVVTFLFQLKDFLSNCKSQNNLTWLFKTWLAKKTTHLTRKASFIGF